MTALALYIHWPFCLAKCPYCDFNSHVRATVDHAQWQQALISDMAHEAALLPGRRLTSIFFGGGTPSLMPPALVESLLDAAARFWTIDPDIEITLEANPSSVEADRFAALARAGINRVSLGIQAMDDQTLHFLGRLHDAAEGLAALDVAQRHFGRVSFDLIYARPGQTQDGWAAELGRALAFGTGHLSLYQLTIEPGTRFATLVREGKLTPLDDDAAADLFALTRDMTGAAGLPAYEISNHARPGQESRHNLTYWRYGDYAGIGPGAHGRRLNQAQTGHGLTEERALPAGEQAGEALLMGLRLNEGVDLTALSARFGLPQDRLIHADKARFYGDLGLIDRTDHRLTVTPQGMPLLDGLLGELVAA